MDVPFVCQNEKDTHQLDFMGFSNVQRFHDKSLSLGGITIHQVNTRHGEDIEVSARIGQCSEVTKTIH